jgi:hypothetical protein
MNNNIISSEINNSTSIEATSSIIMNNYKVEIADSTGHTTLADLSMEQATENILDRVEKKAHWVYINGTPFQFEGSNVRTEANQQKLRQALVNNPAAQVMLTGVVMGGGLLN